MGQLWFLAVPQVRRNRRNHHRPLHEDLLHLCLLKALFMPMQVRQSPRNRPIWALQSFGCCVSLVPQKRQSPLTNQSVSYHSQANLRNRQSRLIWLHGLPAQMLS